MVDLNYIIKKGGSIIQPITPSSLANVWSDKVPLAVDIKYDTWILKTPQDLIYDMIFSMIVL